MVSIIIMPVLFKMLQIILIRHWDRCLLPMFDEDSKSVAMLLHGIDIAISIVNYKVL